MFSWFKKEEETARKIELEVARQVEIWRDRLSNRLAANQTGAMTYSGQVLTEAQVALAAVKSSGEAHVAAIVRAAEVAAKKLLADAIAKVEADQAIVAGKLVAQAKATAQAAVAAVAAATAAATPTA